MDAISAALDGFDIGAPTTAESLTMYPLLVDDDALPGSLSLDETLAAGLTVVTETSDAGSVPELFITNRATVPARHSWAMAPFGESQPAL